MTVLGPKVTGSTVGNSLFLGAAQIRRNSTISIFNSIIAGWPKGLIIDASKGVPTDLNITGTTPSLFVQNNVIAGCNEPLVYAASTTSPTGANNASISGWFNTPAFSNAILTNNEETGLTAAFNYTSPDFSPAANSAVVTGAVYTNSKLAGLQQVSYRGASAAGDTWWRGWTRY